MILIQLIILFTVIFDPPLSFLVFLTATEKLDNKERNKIALFAISLAGGISLLVLFLGENLLMIFNTSINEFRIAGGIILGLLGLKMAMGIPLMDLDKMKEDSGRAIGSIIGTPLLTGPAAITTIIITVNEFGRLYTGLAILIVLLLTSLIFFFTKHIVKVLGKTSIQILSTVMGLITVAWSVKFIHVGINGLL